MAQSNQNHQDEYEDLLVANIKKSEVSGDVISAVIKTDERVIARVTDGIYRQPGSAVRELISNAYDADATRVIIRTDAPRFERISIEDDGMGMNTKTLAHMLVHIGGSAKRHEIGQELGITDPANSLLSPSGRKLIGKIGIGIFSVAQLTHTFQIITKTKGDKFRTVATVALKQYSDEGAKKTKGSQEYESGKVNIWREKAKDIHSHGTTIILTDIKPQTRDTLRSKELWLAIEQSAKNTTVVDEHQLIDPPKFHIGQTDKSNQYLKKIGGKISNLPWDDLDKPDKAFQKLVECVWEEMKYSINPKLETLFDYYLQMVWQISLSIPIRYVYDSLFDMDLSGWTESFQLANEPKGAAKPLSLIKGIQIKEILKLKEGDEKNKFEVFFDDLQLFRPIKFKGLPTSGHALKKPLVFFGKCREEFSKFTKDLSGGVLDFEAYLFWTPKVVPTEHRGSLIRINGASGTLFDPSFMRYQVSEQTRLRQITCEIFIHEGFDSALNIDRESFNYAHPHSVFLTRWLHSALRQLATAQKRLASEIRTESRKETKNQNLNDIQKIAFEVWQEENNDETGAPPSIIIEEVGAQQRLMPENDIRFNRSSIISQRNKQQTDKTKTQLIILDEKIKAIAQVLSSFGLLENLSTKKQERLLKAIYQIIETSE